MEKGYLFNLSDIEEITKIWDSLPKSNKPYYAWFKCEDRGLIKVDLNDFTTCKNPECKQCVDFNNLFKKEIKKIEEKSYLTKEYGKMISISGIVCSKLTSMRDFEAIADEINFKNHPKDYQCFLNKETIERVNSFLDKFKDLFNERVSVKVETGINSFYYYGVYFVLKQNYLNNQNIMIPLDLRLVTEENSILITE